MRFAVVDASVVLKWFKEEGEADRPAALVLRRQFEDGALALSAPSLLPIELLNTLGRRWRWSGDDLVEFATTFENLDFDLVEADLALVARWVARGLTGYDAGYVAVAEALGMPLVTADTEILRVAPAVAYRLADIQRTDAEPEG